MLRPGGWLVILNNVSQDGERGQAVGQIMTPENGVQRAVQQRSAQGQTPPWYYGAGHFQMMTFPFQFQQEWEGFWGGMLSASFMPAPGDPGFDRLEQAARDVFARFSSDGCLTVVGETHLWVGQPKFFFENNICPIS